MTATTHPNNNDEITSFVIKASTMAIMGGKTDTQPTSIASNGPIVSVLFMRNEQKDKKIMNGCTYVY